MYILINPSEEKVYFCKGEMVQSYFWLTGNQVLYAMGRVSMYNFVT